ncbi:MAG: hypothetical protein K5778_03915 [Bacteroidaceae bacterium]|nr:hypothetical protein [Bacteroidaceae bacterium]
MKRTYIQPSATMESVENGFRLMVVVDSDPSHGVDDGFAKERELEEAAQEDKKWQDGLW